MKLFGGPKDEDRFSNALVEVLKSRVKLKGRPGKRQDARGFYRVVADLSPHEYKALKEIAEAHSLSRSKTLRALVRMFKTTPIDGPMEES